MPEPVRPRKVDLGADPKPQEEGKPKARIFSTEETAATEPLARDGRKRPKWATDLKVEIESTYQMLGTVGLMAARGDQFKMAASVNVINQSGAAADAWIDLAEKNPKVKDALTKFVSGTAAAQIFSIHFAMAVPMLAAYGVVPSGFGEMMLGAQNGMTGATAPDPSTNGTGLFN